MNKKILVVGEYYSENLGDGIICDNVKYLISNAFPSATVKIADIMGRTGFDDNPPVPTLQSNDSKTTFRSKLKKSLVNKNGTGVGKLYDRATYLKWKKERSEGIATIQETLKEDFDLVVFAGGQLLYEPFLIPIEAHMDILNEKGTPVIFNGCGIGAFTNAYIRERYKKMMKSPNILSVTVRDYVQEANDKLMVDSELAAVKTDDSALWTKDTYEIDVMTSRGKIGLGIIHRNDALFMKKQETLYSNLMNHFEEQGVEWELFCNGEIIDQVFAEKLLERNGFSKTRLASRTTRPKQLVELINSYKSIISFRLHSHIVATSVRVPSIGMTWDKKVNFFFESFDVGDRCFTVDSDWEEIVEKLADIDQKPVSTGLLTKAKDDLSELLIRKVKTALEKS